MRCKICQKRLQPDEDRICQDCFEFYQWKYEGGFEEALEQYEAQNNADRKNACKGR